MRIAAISDQHGYLPDLPDCDLLIIAGDVCPDLVAGVFAGDAPEAQKIWFDQNVRPWLAASRARQTILTWGNHDWCGECCDFGSHSEEASSGSVRIVVDRLTQVAVEGSERPLTIWASPWSKQFGDWAFMRSEDQLARIYNAIPAGVDIVVSHQPPFGYLDGVPDFHSRQLRHEGSRALLAAIDRVKPKLVICGHIHEGHGKAAHDETGIYNVSVVDERYRLVHPATVIDLY